MNDLVFLDPNRLDAAPFTTSDVIASYAQISHHAVQQMVSKHEASLEAFGQVAFEMRALQTKGGIQEFKIYRLNEEQATLLITFLKNTEPVIKFKVELVRQFYAMRSELMKRRMERTGLKPIRRELTDVIQEAAPGNKWAYKHYTDLAYKVVTGKNAAQLRQERSAPKHPAAIDYMTSAEIEQVAKAQSQIAVLVEMGMSYDQIKALMVNRLMVGRIA